jgi:hypothetical protein
MGKKKGGVEIEILNTLANVPSLTYVCAAVIVLYVAVAKPGNTPAMFRNLFFKVALFAFVFLATVLDPLLGTFFGLAMILSVLYANAELTSAQADLRNVVTEE